MSQVMAASGDQPWETPYFQKLYSITKIQFEKNTTVAGPPNIRARNLRDTAKMPSSGASCSQDTAGLSMQDSSIWPAFDA
jgi:hypothetical protein